MGAVGSRPRLSRFPVLKQEGNMSVRDKTIAGAYEIPSVQIALWRAAPWFAAVRVGVSLVLRGKSLLRALRAARATAKRPLVGPGSEPWERARKTDVGQGS